MTLSSLSRRALCAALLFASATAGAAEWESLFTDRDVEVLRMEVEGSRLVMFKGDTVFDAPLDRVLYVLMDHEHRIEWVDRLYDNQMLEERNEWDYVLYQAYDLPLTFASRDYVYNGVATVDDAGVVTLEMQSIEHPDAPETVGVRAELLDSRYRLTPVSETQTRCEVEIRTDPKGWMPIWLVNRVQKSWPVETLSGVRDQLGKDHVGSYPLPGSDTEPLPDELPPEEPGPEAVPDTQPAEALVESEPARADGSESGSQE